ncbi:MAG TPA: histidine phosphatase family protein [Candidatus Hydrogenedentes bacterium]|nr:histidine phosphatase family protein [Candidatus Hydrogenedentota bacterium]HPG68415.1 histidine phosphatase family protein [Candidatus Hydrogenedentota bacterium]
MLIFLVRHGQSEGNVDGPLMGSTDPPLTPQGLWQAELAGRRLKELGVRALFCGPLRRNIETAVRIGKVSGLKPVLLPLLFEVSCNQDVYERSEVASYFPDVDLSVQMPAVKRDAPETWDMGRQRARYIVQCLRTQYEATDTNVALITHGNISQLLIEAILGIPPIRAAWLCSGNCSFHLLYAAPDQALVCRLNDESHIPEQDRS